MSFELTTPFDAIKTLSLSAQYSWTTSQKSATLNITYNDKNFVLSSSLQLSTRASDITFQARTPFSGFQHTFIEIKYDIDNREELLAFRVNADDHRYSFVVGGFIEDKLAIFKWNLNSPFSGWTDAKFVAKIDLSSENKNLEISLEKEGDLKAIAVSGKFIGSTLDFNLQTPFRGLNNFNVFGSLNRSKRSLEMRMMNDAGHASLAGNFNSLRFNMKTPFERAEQISWEITKTGEGSYNAEWRRNDNYATLTIEKDGKKNSFQVNVKSEFRGWEILALTGRLDQETKQAYLSGAINEQKITISGSGSFGSRSNYSMKIETPYDNYRVVDIQLDYVKRRNTMKIEASSSSSDFHLLWSRSGSGLEAHLIVPNSQQNTEISINLTPTQGKITITSRFEPIRDYLQEYHVNLGETVITADHIIKLNGHEVFKMEFERNASEQKGHLEIHIHVAERHTTIHFHREGFSKLHFLFKREVPQYGEKHFKVDITGSGALPEKGALDIVVENTFREPARTINARVEVDRTGARKKIKLEVTPRQSRLYVFNLEYDADLQSPRHGDFTLSITTPARRAAPWQNMSGNWNIENPNDATITFTMGNVTYNARGKLTLRESTMVLSSTNPSAENIFLQWKFERDGNNRDYFLKLGRESKYGMLKLKGTITDIAHVDIEGGFKAGPFMPNEFLFTSMWDKSNGVVTGEGTFDYGSYHGSHRLVKFERNAARKSASFEWSATSNIPQYNSVSVSGNYDFDRKVVIFVLINADGRESKIDVNIADINPTRSRNTVMISIPLLGSTFERTELTVSHDFSHPNRKSISAVAKFGRSQSFINAKWNRSDGFETLEGNIEAKSRFLGDFLINVRYDMSNIADAHAEVDYSRTTTDGDKKEFKLNWTRKSTDGHLENEMIFDSNFDTLSHARAYANAEYGNNFKLLSGLDWNDKKISLTLEVRKNKVSGQLTTPFEGFETIEVDLQYKLTGKDKSVNATYQRGDRKASLNMELSMKGKKGGSFNVDVSTPFEVVKNLHIDGQYENKVAQINYQRNDIQMNFSGKANIKSSKASFDISFTPPSGQNIRIAASYDVQDFIAGTGTEEKELASLSLEFEGNSLDFSLHGFRNDDRLYVMIHGSSSFALLKMFHLKLDSELNTEARDGTFELTFNDFKFNVSNHFERRENNGYYFRSKIESTLTPLPALIIGLGREGEERIITIGYGEDKEITFSVKGKNKFLSGFSGKVDVPSLGYEGVEYEVDYSFPGDDHLQIHVEIDLNENGQEVEATFFLDSEGIKARLTSTVLGDHSLRVRRSVSPDGFYAEAGLDDYSLKLRGGFKNEDTARGVQLEGEVFGNRFLIDTLFQSEGKRYSEGKLIIHTPFPGMEKMGGLFTWSNANKKIMAHAELHLPSYITPTITGEISLDLKKKINGYVTLDVAGEEFTLKCNLAGSSISQGYTGSLEFFSPLHAVSHVVLTGDIKMQALSFLDMEVKIDAPFATHDLKLKYQLSADKVSGEAFLESTRLYNSIQLSLNIEGLTTENVEVDLTVNDNKINAHYTLAQSTFKFDVTTIIFNKERQFSIEAKYPSLESLEGVVAVTLEGDKHMISGSLNISNNRIQGTLDLESDLIEGPRKLVLDVSKPSASYEQASFKIIFTSSEPHSFYLDLDLRSGLEATVKIDTPVFPKVTTTLQVAPAIAGITIETPKGTHKVQVSWRQTRRMPSDWIASLELISPLLPENYLFSVNLGSKHIMAELQTGSIKHTLEARTSVSNYGGDLSLVIDTPFENINKVTLDAALNFKNNVKMDITAKFANTLNSLRFNLDKENRKLISIVESPYIPTGMAEVEAMLTGNTNENMKMKMALKNAEDTIAGILNIKIKSSQNINTNLKIITPFKGYKKMNFGARYLKDEVTNISVFADKPLKFKADLQFGNTEDVVTTNLIVETPIEHFERIEAEMKIPLYKFAPKVMLTLPHNQHGFTADHGSDSISQKLSAGVTVNEESYDGYYSLRTKAPYELAYGYNLAHLASTRFHLRTDSSFFSVFA
uniref:Beta-1,3-glucan binding protein n=1 Tax=Penaeus merguiensis TaxID=71412 RepID=A0A0A7D6G0_PENME|nr:beta-1,3-glucan binding protein [Penaeus merguiensis]